VLRESEVGQVRVLLAFVDGDKDVGRLHVPVNQTAPVRRIERGCHRTQHRHGSVGPQGSLVRDEGPKIRPADVPHGDEQVTLDLTRVVDGHDVGVLEPRGELGFADEPRPEGLVGGELGSQDLDRGPPAQSLVLGQVDDTHPASA